jgi:hypothetical protein
VAVVAMVIVFYNVYQYFRAQIFLEIYKMSASSLSKLSQSVATRLKQATPTAAVDSVVNVSHMISEAYSMIPSSLRKLIVFFLSQVPILKIVTDSRQKIVASDNVEATNKTYRLIDTNVRAFIDKQIGMMKTWLLLAANVIIQILIIFWLM